MSGKDQYQKLLNSYLTDREIENAEIKGDFTAKLIKARKQRNLTQRELAKLAGLNQSAIARIENEGVMPRLDTVYRILMAIGSDFIVDVDEFVKEILDKNKKEFNNEIKLEFKRINNRVDNLIKLIARLNGKIDKLEASNRQFNKYQVGHKKWPDRFMSYSNTDDYVRPGRTLTAYLEEI